MLTVYLNRGASYLKLVAVALVLGAFLGIASVAWAVDNQAWSSVGYTPSVKGIVYDTQSWVDVGEPGSPSDWASSYVEANTGTTLVKPGWMGVDARKYRNGGVCEQTGYQLNSDPAGYQSASAASKACGSGTYYSYGVIEVWNGNGYNYYYSQRSPSLNG